ncbi:MAG: hypothetical protein KF851_07880 [Pirellulaceae bacterium]|nr:hypothetical protein [Pirellulaceae bacterium]
MIRLSAFLLTVMAMAAWSDTASAQHFHRGGGTVISVGFGNTGISHWSGYRGPGWGYGYPVAPMYHPGFYGGYHGVYRPPVYYGSPYGYGRRCW